MIHKHSLLVLAFQWLLVLSTQTRLAAATRTLSLPPLPCGFHSFSSHDQVTASAAVAVAMEEDTNAVAGVLEKGRSALLFVGEGAATSPSDPAQQEPSGQQQIWR